MEAFISKSKRFAAALKHIDDGEFGICLECEEPISPKRLAGLPWAGYCLHCQELRDSEEATDTGRAENGRLRPPGRASRQNDPNRPRILSLPFHQASRTGAEPRHLLRHAPVRAG